MRRVGALVGAPVVAIIVACAGCHGAKSVSRWRACFGGFGAPIDTANAECTFDTVDQLLSCAGSDGNREVDVSIVGNVGSGVRYPVGVVAAPYATVAFNDATPFDLAGGGAAQWSGVDGHVDLTLWDGARVAFAYAATMKPSDGVTPGMFALSGDASVVSVQTLK